MAFTAGWFCKVIHSRVRAQAMAKLAARVVTPQWQSHPGKDVRDTFIHLLVFLFCFFTSTFTGVLRSLCDSSMFVTWGNGVRKPSFSHLFTGGNLTQAGGGI